MFLKLVDTAAPAPLDVIDVVHEVEHDETMDETLVPADEAAWRRAFA